MLQIIDNVPLAGDEFANREQNKVLYQNFRVIRTQIGGVLIVGETDFGAVGAGASSTQVIDNPLESDDFDCGIAAAGSIEPNDIDVSVVSALGFATIRYYGVNSIAVPAQGQIAIALQNRNPAAQDCVVRWWLRERMT